MNIFLTKFKVCDYTRKRFHRPVYLRLLTSSGYLWNSVLVVLSPAIWLRSMELRRQTKEKLVKFIIDMQEQRLRTEICILTFRIHRLNIPFSSYYLPNLHFSYLAFQTLFQQQ
jgi:hypothetical protein